VAQEAVAIARTNRPVLIEAKTYRYRGHSVSDAGLYRSKEEVEAYKALDPIERIRRDLVTEGWQTQEQLEVLDAEVADAIRDAVQFADESPEPPLSELHRHVFAEEA
jgi:pyruvate dehydrogenase E1 component alpha subunit